MSPDSAIGVFDSGIGGLTVARVIHQELPNEQLIYYGDTAHLPYGEKSAESIRSYCEHIVEFLLDRNCKMIVMACYSASSVAYDFLVKKYGKEALFVNVIDPLVNLLIQKNYKRVGVIATKATTQSNAFKEKILAQTSGVEVKQLATPLLAPMIEEGFYKNHISVEIINHYLSNNELKDIEVLLLACTHYPLIKDHISDYYQGAVEVIDSAVPVAKHISNILTDKALLRGSTRDSHQFYLSDYTQSFAETAALFYKDNISLQKVS